MAGKEAKHVADTDGVSANVQAGTQSTDAPALEPDPNVETLPTRLVTEAFDPSKLEKKEGK